MNEPNERTSTKAPVDDEVLDSAEGLRDREAAARKEEGESLTLFAFDLRGVTLAVDAACVLAIHEPKEPSPVPGCPAHVAGVMSQSGRVIAVLDLAGFLSLPPPADEDGGAVRRMLVLAGGGLEVGALCDRARGLIEAPRSEISPPVVLASGKMGRFVMGEVQRDRDVIGVLDIASLLEAARA